MEKVYVQKIKLLLVREETNDEKIRIERPEHIAALKLIKDELIDCDREKFICLHLNTKNQILSYEVISIGSINASLVHPRELFKGAILSNASFVILCHNHPSGEPEPSREDIRLTKRLKEAGDLLGIEVLDHLVIGENKYVSLKEEGLL